MFYYFFYRANTKLTLFDYEKLIFETFKNSIFKCFYAIVLQKNISIQQGKQTFVTDVSNLKAGIYFIQIKAKEKVVDTQKLIVAH